MSADVAVKYDSRTSTSSPEDQETFTITVKTGKSRRSIKLDRSDAKFVRTELNRLLSINPDYTGTLPAQEAVEPE